VDSTTCRSAYLTHFHPGAQVVGYNDLPNVNAPGPGLDVREWWANEEK
jgi:hypothetical protein